MEIFVQRDSKTGRGGAKRKIMEPSRNTWSLQNFKREKFIKTRVCKNERARIREFSSLLTSKGKRKKKKICMQRCVIIGWFFSSRSRRFVRQATNEIFAGSRNTRFFPRAINYTREANLSESIIITARQNYVLTLRKARCSWRSTPWLITATRSFYHFFRSSGSIIPCNVIYEASGFDEAGRWNGVITSLFRSRSDNFSRVSPYSTLFYLLPLVLIMLPATYAAHALIVLYVFR